MPACSSSVLLNEIDSHLKLEKFVLGPKVDSVDEQTSLTSMKLRDKFTIGVPFYSAMISIFLLFLGS